MEQFSTSKVTVECYDPHDVYKLISPGLVPRLPLRHLHWHSHAGPLRSIDTLHVELTQAGSDHASPEPNPRRSASVSTNQDAGTAPSVDGTEASASQPNTKGRRHQIPGLRRTPYLKTLLVRCDDSESYKGRVRAEIREWIKQNTTQTKKGTPEGHDAFEWLIVHVVLPNTAAATQPRSSKSDASTADQKNSSRWRGSSSTLLEKMKADFNVAGKGAVDRVAQVRVGINDVPYDMLPRVVPAVPSGYVDTEQDLEIAWQDLITKFKDLILTSFDIRVTRYEEDVKEKDAQRMLPGWNFCTFFILKEGLARGFESVGLVEDALVGYDELSVGLDAIIAEQAAASGAPERHGGALLPYTNGLKDAVNTALESLNTDAEGGGAQLGDALNADDIPIIASKKPYRDMILENNVSLFDFKCYIFARQISLLLRLGNAWSTREELLAKLKEQQELVMHGVAPHTPPTKDTEEPENLLRLSEICKRALEFIPLVSRAMQQDILAAVASDRSGEETPKQMPPSLASVVDHMVASFAFSLAQQILAQTSTKALPIPPSTLTTPDGHEPKLSIPEPKTMMHPARSSSLGVPAGTRLPPSPNTFPGPGNTSGPSEKDAAVQSQFLKAGLEELAARRAELYSVCRNILEKLGKKKGWGDGWSDVPVLPDAVDPSDMEDVNLDDDDETGPSSTTGDTPDNNESLALHVVSNPLLCAAFKSQEDFYRLYETLTDKALRHYTVANHNNSIQANLADLAVLKYKLNDFGASASYFHRSTPFFGESGWSLLELSMLVMYSRCLRELDRKESFVQVTLKLLMKAAAAATEYASQASVRRSVEGGKGGFSAVRGMVAELLAAAETLSGEVVVPLSSFFLSIDVCGAPTYPEGSDRVEVEVELHSLLVDELPVEKARLRMTCVDGGPMPEIWLECVGKQVVKPGKGRLTFVGNVVTTGRYKVDQLHLENGRLVFSYERDVDQITPRDETVFRNPPLLIYQQVGSFDLQLTAAKHTRLDQNNTLELEISPGWNDIQSCELSVKPSTGGLRTITAEAKVISNDAEFAKAPEAGMLFFGNIASGSSVTVRFPFSMEQDIPTISVRLEARYVTSDGTTFHCAKLVSVPIALALGVNVQDVFKHAALYSRFTVSTASVSPLRVFGSELTGSEVFETHFGVRPGTTLVFPKQPGTLLYKVTRKEGSRGKGTMYLKLEYSVFRDEVEELLRRQVGAALGDSELGRFERLLQPIIWRHAHRKIEAGDLERAAMTGTVLPAFVGGIHWQAELQGLDHPGSKPTIPEIKAFFEKWLKGNKMLTLEEPEQHKSIVIPVDVPSVPILVTADIKLGPETELLGAHVDPVPTVCVNQVLPARLELKWTRRWDVSDSKPKGHRLSFEVVAPGDTWLLSGRRRGHIVVAPPTGTVTSPDEEEENQKMTVPLMLAPLREGYLPYPSVEVREVKEGDERGGHCEMDWRNVGEVMRVVEGRGAVTVSLDEGGVGGGPLVVERGREAVRLLV